MTRRTFTDDELTDPTFPDPRMKESDQRPLRHEWYRQREISRRRNKVLERAAQLIDKLFETERTKTP